MFKCLIIDDEELARALLESYVKKLDFLELHGSYESPLDAMVTLKEQAIDVIFLDIQMPDLKGTDFAKMIPAETKVIFTTAYSDYAIQGFELDALDYLLKPITFERFLKAVSKLKVTHTEVSKTEYITIKSGYDLHKIKLEDIDYIESDSEYVVFYLNGRKIMSYQTLKSLEKTLPTSMFLRVHRSYIVNKAKVTGLKGRDLLLNEIIIPVSDSYYNTVKSELF
ncbi:LytR/AlgR family response regulator transcription factor [Formosa algae]|uniref:DNA-binding LytR/AlgR family response regulator n=1 Tax=Formosa algae TaxID=225843 RepID=A0A9X1C9U0_9FLAO|nr:LytTR family DNA-binding domain-containing protein [Formosa algae]MBP1840933.1 DNA-binding LytR/AlgR family response regulator [Formosa algae]MDQ0336170.1 DNA-binding LytR/AlgR family response regulator [Formosa algae]OEI79947.1 DNA-binding response regulator [Formosa algae]